MTKAVTGICLHPEILTTTALTLGARIVADYVVRVKDKLNYP
jgi:hypothetical protein